MIVTETKITVAELIEKLKQFDQDAIVLTQNNPVSIADLKHIDDVYEKTVGFPDFSFLDKVDLRFRKAVIIV